MFSCTHDSRDCSKLSCGCRTWICRLCIYSEYSCEDDIGFSMAYDSFYTPLQSTAKLGEVSSDVL